MSQDTARKPSIATVGSASAGQVAGAAYANTVGTITTATSTVTSGDVGLAGNLTIAVFGTYAGVNVTFEASPDAGTNWFAWAVTREDIGVSDTTSGVLPANTSRAWTVSAPGFNRFRVRATAWTSGTANVIIAAGTYPIEPMVSAIIRRPAVATYSAGYRLVNATAAARVLSTPTLTANTNKQLATIYHAASATKRVQVKYVCVTLHGITVAGNVEFEIVTLSAATAPATGNPAITPGKHDQADPAAEVTCLALPTTAGSVVNADVPVGDIWEASYGAAGSAVTTTPPPVACKAVLWDSRATTDGKDLIMRAGVAEGYAINVRCSSASVVICVATIMFTEE